MGSEGEIVLVKNIVFQGGEEKVADLKSLRGRPCLIIDETRLNLYMLPLSTTPYQNPNNQIYTGLIKKSQIYDRTNYQIADLSYVRLKELIRRDMCFFKSIGTIDEGTYQKILKKLLRYYELLKQNPINGEFYREIEHDLQEQARILKLK